MIKVWDYKKEYELLREEILSAVDEVFKSGILIFGPNVEKFEEKFSSYHDCKYGIGVGNCTDAITIALKALDKKTGARGLRSIIENILLDTMFKLPDI